MRINGLMRTASRDDSIAGSLDHEIKTAEREVVEARARYLLGKKITEGVVTTDPSLRSVHAGENIQARERYGRANCGIHFRDLSALGNYYPVFTAATCSP